MHTERRTHTRLRISPHQCKPRVEINADYRDSLRMLADVVINEFAEAPLFDMYLESDSKEIWFQNRVGKHMLTLHLDQLLRKLYLKHNEPDFLDSTIDEVKAFIDNASRRAYERTSGLKVKVVSRWQVCNESILNQMARSLKLKQYEAEYDHSTTVTLGDHHSLVLMKSGIRGEEQVNQEELSHRDLTIEEAINAQIIDAQNELNKNLERVYLADGSLYRISNRDSFSAAWVFSKNLQAVAPVKGEHLLFQISEESAVLVGTEDHGALHAVISIQLKQWQKDDYGHPPFPLLISKKGPSTWNVPQGCMMLSLLKLEQDWHLERLYRKHNRRLHRLSSVGKNLGQFNYLVKGDGSVNSYTTVHLGKDNVIPKADFYTFVHKTGYETYRVAAATREKVFEHFGRQFFHLFEYPNRYEYDGKFTFEQVAAVGINELIEPIEDCRPDCPYDQIFISKDPYLEKLYSRLARSAARRQAG